MRPEAQVRELLLGREPTADNPAGMFGMLSFDACLLEGSASSLEAALVAQFVQPLLRALDQMERQRRARDQLKMVTAAAAAAESVAVKARRRRSVLPHSSGPLLL